MSVSKEISLLRVRKELTNCIEYGEKVGWIISEIDESNQSFTVQMTSPIDKEIYVIEVIFNNYPEIPLLIDFIYYQTAQKGLPIAYPKNKDSFFHPNGPCICNPCSRKSYKEFINTGHHGDWKMIGWQQNPKVGTLTSVDAILRTIYSRISNSDYYEKRMG